MRKKAESLSLLCKNSRDLTATAVHYLIVISS